MAGENNLGGSIGLDTTDFKKGVSELKNQIKNIETSFRTSAVAMESWGNTSNGLKERINSLREEIGKQKQEMEIYRQELEKVSSGSETDQKAADSLTNKMYSLQKQIGYNEKSFQKYSEQLASTEKSEKENSSSASKLGKSFMEMAEKSRQSTSLIKEHFNNLRGSIIGAIGGIIAGMSIKEVAEDTDAAEKNLSQMNAVLKSTGDASGMTKNQLVGLAEAQSKVTTYSAETTEKAEDMLLTFTKIGKNVFPETVQATLDMATAMHTDATSAALQLGKALNDPATGYSKLQRVGVTFTASQVKTIKAMEKAGNTAGAQKVILQELKKEYGNSAKAAGTTLTGQIQIMQNNVKSAGVQIMGAILPIVQNIMPSIVKGIQGLAAQIVAHKAQIVGAFTAVGNGIKSVFGWVESHGPQTKGIIIGIASAIGIWKAAMLTANTIATIRNGLEAIGIIKSGEAAVATAANTAATTAQTGAQMALNVAESANPIGLVILGIAGATAAIAGLVIGIKALVKHFQSSSIETKKFGSNVSASTQKAVTAFNDLDQKADKSLKELAITGKTVTKTMADDIKKNIDGMANQTIAGFQKQRDESIKAIQGLATKGSGITQKQMQQMVSDVNVGYKQRITNEQQDQSKIDKILQNAASKHRSLTTQESDQISSIKSQMYSNGVKALSKNQVEEQAIYDNMRVNHTATSAQEAASIVKDSKTTTDKVVGDANQKYKDTVSAIERERDETHTISSDQADQLIKAAKKQRDDSVSAAQDQHKKVVAEAKKQAGDQVNQVDWTNGQVKSKWQVFQDNWNSFWGGWSAAAGEDLDAFKIRAIHKWEEIKLGVIKKWDGIKSGWNDFWGKFQSNAQSGWSSFKSNWNNFWGHIGDAIKNLNPIQWGKDLIDGIANGIKSAASHVKTAVSNVAQNIRDYLHFSVPDVGPLSDADTYGLDFMQLLADTISKNSDKPADAAKAAAQLVAQHIQQVKTDFAKALEDISGRSETLNAEEAEALQNATAEQRASIQAEYDQKRQTLSEEAALRKRQADQEIAEIDRIGKESKDELDQEIQGRKNLASNVNNLVDEIKNDLKKKYDQEEQAQEAHINKQLNKLEDWKTKSEDTINDVYSDKIQAAENAANAATAAIQKELDALDAQKAADSRAETRKGYTDKISDLKSQIKYSHDAYNTAQLQKQLEQEQTAYQKELDSEALADKKAALNNQMAAVKANLDQQKAALQAEQQTELDSITKIYNARKTSLNNQLQRVKDTYSKMEEDANLEAQAEQMIMKNNQNEIITLLNSYSDTYKLTGQTLGDKLAEGFQPAIDNIKSMISSIDDAISSARNSALDALSEAKAAKVATRSSFTTNNNSRVNNINVSITSPRALSASQQSRQAAATVQRALFQVG